MTNTPNYNLPLYADADAVDLIAGYNAAMTKIDTALKTISDAASKKFVTSASDKAFSVKSLAGAKVNEDGIVYFKTNQG